MIAENSVYLLAKLILDDSSRLICFMLSICTEDDDPSSETQPNAKTSLKIHHSLMVSSLSLCSSRA